LNLSLFIAGRLAGKKATNRFSGPIIRIAIISIALGLAVMILSVAIVTGFQKEIRDRVISFGSHAQITNYDLRYSPEGSPVSIKQDFYPYWDTIPGIRHIQTFSLKTGILKTDSDIQGVILKGVGTDFDWDFFGDKLIEGRKLILNDTSRSRDLIVSSYMAKKLMLSPGQKVVMYFVQEPPNPPRYLQLEVSGIYETGLEEIDQTFIMCDIRQIQRLNGWAEGYVGGFEVILDDFEQLDQMSQFLYQNLHYSLNLKTIKELYPQVFDWLSLLDMNVYVILFLLVIVAAINMISTLLISILEHTRMIGVLKALGANNSLIRKIFLSHATFLISRGLIWGNVIGIAVCLFQYYTRLFKLPGESYYVSFVPINFDWFSLIWLNAGTLAVCLLMLLLPSLVVSKIQPVKAISFR